MDISVIVPAFNASTHLSTALDSVAHQSVVQSESLGVEVVLVDDGSTDTTVEVFGKWCEDNSSIPAKLHSQPNLGPSAARNAGFSISTAAVIVFLDADDWLLPTKLERQWNLLAANPNLGGIHSGWQTADHAGKVLQTIQPWHAAPQLNLHTWLLHKPVRIGAMMLRRSWLEKLKMSSQIENASQSGPFDESLWQSEDTDLMLRLAMVGCPMEWLREPTTVYRHHECSLVHSDPQQQARSNADLLDRFYAQPGLARHIRRDESTIRYHTYVWIACHLLQSGCNQAAVAWLKAAAHVRCLDGAECVDDWTQQFASWSRDNRSGSIDVREVIEAASHTVNRQSRWTTAIRNWVEPFWTDSTRPNEKKIPLLVPPFSAPVIKARTPNSVLDPKRANDARQLYTGARRRPATCSGAAWFHDDYLVTGNLWGRSVHVYRFDRVSSELHLIQSIEDSPAIHGVENLAVSADGRLCAITNQTDRAVALFGIDGETHEIASRPTVVLRNEEDRNLHGVSFSPCSRFLAVTTVDEPGLIRLFRMSWHGRKLQVDAMPVFVTSWSPSRPKGIDFAPDGGSVVICFALNAGKEPVSANDSHLMMFRFDPVTGIQPRPVATASTREPIAVCDDVRFFPSGRHVILSEQDADQVSIIEWDPKRDRFGDRVAVYRSTASGLAFPHGISVSADGCYFAVTNYADDSVAVFKSPLD